jgi:pilus assembly protein CpaE
MFVQLNCIIVDADTANRQELTQFLTAQGLNVMAALGSVESLPGLLAPGTARLAIVNIDPAAHENLQRVGGLIRQFPRTTFFVMSAAVDAGLVMEAMHQGVKDFIPLPVNQQKFLASIERIAVSEGGDKRAKVINVIPTMGGCGATTIACNVAA